MKGKETLVRNGLLEFHTGVMFYGQGLIFPIGR